MKRSKGFVTRQAKRLSDGEINRRRFVMSALSAGVTMPTALSLASKAEAQVPKRGGMLRMALAEGSATDSLDPTTAANSFTRTLAQAFGNTLAEIGPDGGITGVLAETFEPSSDFRHWALTLRQGVTFHDGADLDAQALKANLTRWRDAGLMPDLREVHVAAPDRIEVAFHAPQPELPRHLADPRLILLSPEGPTDTPMGTGPYRLHAFQPGRVVDLTRVDHYWRPDRAYFDTVRLFAMPDAPLRQSALMTGEVDFADRIDPRGIALLQRAPSVEVSEDVSERSLIASFDPGRGLSDDLRSAVLAAIPGDVLVERVLLGHGSSPVEVRDMETTRPAGPIEISVSDDPIARDAAGIIVEAAARAGLVLRPKAPGAPADLHLGISNRTADLTAHDHVILSMNDLSAHRTTLCRPGAPTANLKGEPARLIEQGWFA